MDQNTYLGLMALSEGFGNLSNIGAGRPTQQSQVLPLLMQQKEKEAKRAQVMAALRAAGINIPGAEGGTMQDPATPGILPPDEAAARAPQPGMGSALPSGANPGLLAAFGAMNPEALLGSLVEAQINPKAPPAGPTSVQEYNALKAEGYAGTLQDFMRDKATWSRAPGTNVTIKNEGSIPPGYEIERDEQGRPLRMRPIAGSPAYSDAVNAAGDAVQSADQAIQVLDGLINDPNLPKATGWGSYIPIDIPGFNAETRSRMEQVQGTAFLQAYESLKGGGQITEVEGLKAEQAIARLKTAQSAPEYQKALREFRDVIDAGRKRAARNLQTTTGRATPGAPPLTSNEMADEELMRALGLE